MTVAKEDMRRCDTRFWLALVSTAIMALVIAGLTLTPVTGPEIIDKHSDKLYHIVAFAALTFPSALLHPRLFVYVLVFAILFGAAIEIIQPSVGRSGSWGDLVADIAGALLGAVTGQILGKFPPQQSTNRRDKAN